MIRSLRLVDFKSFSDASLRLGPFTLIVGTNASGKSNIRDAFRFLHGIGRGYKLAEIIGGKYGAGGQAEWMQMRGAAREIVRLGKSSFCLEVDLSLEKGPAKYTINVEHSEGGRGDFRLIHESLAVNGKMIYSSRPGPTYPIDQQIDNHSLLIGMGMIGQQLPSHSIIRVSRARPALEQIAGMAEVHDEHAEIASQVVDVFGSMRFLDLVPDAMRKPGFPGQTVLGDSGENLPTVLQDICADPERKAVFSEWVRELTPMDVADLEFPSDPITGLVQLVIREADGSRISALSASDGTLRFLAMLAALLGTNPAHLYFFEEIDNGIHPSRLRLLLDLIEGQTAKGGIQVVTTTHSPDLLSLIGDNTFDNTSVVYRLPDQGGSRIRPVADLPNAASLRASQGLGRLHASGWMEDALAFTEGDCEAGDQGEGDGE